MSSSLEAAHRTLLGIELRVANPTSYLLGLRAAIERAYPDWRAPVTAISALLRPEDEQLPREERLGWYEPENLVPLLHREWLEGQTNEFSQLEEYLAREKIFNPNESVMVCGAGVCRLAEWLNRHLAVDVVCSDLSWVGLYSGSLMMSGASAALPPSLNAALVRYEAASDGKTLNRHLWPPRWHQPTAQPKFCYRVEDAFGLAEPYPAPTICLPYLLDAFGDSTTLLLRLLLGLRLGRSMVIIVSLIGGREPSVIMEALSIAGLEVERVDLTQLPYSFSRHDFSYRKETLPTLVVRARKTTESQLSRVAVSADSKPATVQFDLANDKFVVTRKTAQGQTPTVMGEDLFASYRVCREGGDYATVCLRLANLVGDDNVELVLRHLTSTSLIALRPAS